MAVMVDFRYLFLETQKVWVPVRSEILQISFICKNFFLKKRSAKIISAINLNLMISNKYPLVYNQSFVTFILVFCTYDKVQQITTGFITENIV